MSPRLSSNRCRGRTAKTWSVTVGGEDFVILVGRVVGISESSSEETSIGIGSICVTGRVLGWSLFGGDGSGGGIVDLGVTRDGPATICAWGALARRF